MKNRKVHRSRRGIISPAKRLLLLIAPLLCLAVAPVAVQAQASCEESVTTARQLYNDARFDEAIALLHRCLEQGAFSESEQPQVYTLLSMLCFANREEADARQAIRVLLSLNPAYQPDPIRAQPSYRALVEDVRSELQPALPAVATSPVAAAANDRKERRGLKKWLYLGGGAVLTGAAFLLIGAAGQSNQGGGSNPPPPGQPPRPPGGS